jgi:hypothetical protein
MLRLRLASLALASGLLLTASGCLSSSGCFSSSGCDSSGPMFPRLFHRSESQSAMMGGTGCECQRSAWPQGVEVPAGQGPFLMPGAVSTPPTSSIPIVNVPTGTPQSLPLKAPPAPPTAYFPNVN